MANNPKIEVEIGGNIQGLKNSVGQADRILDNLGNSANQASPKVNNLANSIKGTNTVGIEFSRIIQDAPFGIIGVGNNITQLAGSFSNLQKQTGSSTKALSLALQSIISPANLVVLGVSAITTAFTLYQTGAFGAKEATDDLKKAQESLNDTFKETDRLARAAFYQEIIKDLGLVRFEVDETGKALGAVPTNLPFEEQLERIAGKIKTATKPQLEALEQFLRENYQGAIRLAANATSDLERQIANSQANEYKTQLGLVTEQLAFYKNETDKAKESVDKLAKSVRNSVSALQLQNTSLEQLAQKLRDVYNARQTGGTVQLTPQQALEQAIQNAPGISDRIIPNIGDQFDEEKVKIIDSVDELSSAFTGLGSLIGSAFNNTGLGQFVGQFLGFAAKLIAANFKIATSSAIAGASNSAAATGPGAVFTLPAFIAGAVGLVASAFAAIGGGGGGRGVSGVGAVGVGTTFNGTSSESFSSNRAIALTGRLGIDGNELVYFIDQTRIKQD